MVLCQAIFLFLVMAHSLADNMFILRIDPNLNVFFFVACP